MIRERSAGVVVVRNGKVLLLLYCAGHWDLPKGNIERGEEPRAAALRELFEETGLRGVIIEGFHTRIHYFYKKQGKLVSKDVDFYIARPLNSKVKLSYEHKDFAWLDWDDAIEKATYKSAKEVLIRARKFLEKR
ncbi:NUDIX domain-containing protein [Candidatus Woesearchaeota archaeon]|nr:MAG: NUDIX domain-containing protein [Candidatus Woesearchaeota archaeon]